MAIVVMWMDDDKRMRAEASGQQVTMWTLGIRSAKK
jgi:hypothetical protein